jgi:hypothetical protein
MMLSLFELPTDLIVCMLQGSLAFPEQDQVVMVLATKRTRLEQNMKSAHDIVKDCGITCHGAVPVHFPNGLLAPALAKTI